MTMAIDRKKLRELVEAAPKGPWIVTPGRPNRALIESACGNLIAECWVGNDRMDATNDFLAAAREAVPAFLDEIERLERELKACVKAEYCEPRGVSDW